MDNSEFVNQYIDIATKNLHDLMGRNLISETRAVVAEKALTALRTQYEELETKVSELESFEKALNEINPKYEKASAELEEAQLTVKQLSGMKQECDDLKSRYDALVQEAQSLRVNYDSVRNDLGIARARIAELDKTNEEILESNQELRNMVEQLTTNPKPATEAASKKKPPTSK